LKKASELAFKMVAHFGMSERIGPVYHEHRSEHPFLGQMLATEAGGTSDATVHLIEEETRELLTAAVAAARRVIADHREMLDKLVNVLVEQESVEREQLERLLGPVLRGHRAPLEEPLHAR
jgi:cell division protease FtsH